MQKKKSKKHRSKVQKLWDITRVCLLGDAAFVLRPHTAAGVSKAATDAVALANSISISSSVNVIEALKRVGTTSDRIWK